MPSLNDTKAANSTYKPEYVPVMLVTGGTAGIGQAIAEAFCQYVKGRVHIIIVGRNQQAADTVLASLPRSDGSTYEFINCDLTLMKNIQSMTDKLKARLAKVNFLVHCAAVVGLGGRVETEEGIDVKLALRYYARWKLTYELLPLLKNAKALGEDAGVLTVLGAGLGPEIDLEDLGLKKTYKAMKAMAQSTAYNDLMVAEFAAQNPDMAFIHTYPGPVVTGTISNQSIITKILVIPLLPLLWLISTPKADCAEYMLFPLLEAKVGMHRRGTRGDDVGMIKFPQAKDAQKLLWEHTLEATTVNFSD